ncbi:MAG: alpha/beta hydrolase [Xanthomonadales bacterium]|jgi:pimeloyl-ACP methyl ester carboxylesterase|nr:alpha/beta hydrolase [Xanthomonadales bacterium]
MLKRSLLLMLVPLLLPLALSAQEPAPLVVPEGEIELTADEDPKMEQAPAVELPPADLFARDSYRVDPVVCPFKGDVEYEPGDIECGLLQVPENRENPNSRFIELHFVKLNSRWGKDDEKDKKDKDKKDYGLAPGKRDDPVIYLTGGPGAQVTYYVKRFKDHGLLDHRDMYILEQRGIGFSGDFCPFYSGRKPATDDVATFEESLAASLTRFSDCARNAQATGVDLTGYNTMENARDVKALRRALAIEKWNVWGISYGSILAQAYLNEDPGGILAAAIDAVVPLDRRESELYWRVAHWYQRDLEKLQEICSRQPACAEHYPDISGRIRQAIGSVVNQPIEVEVEDIENYPSGKARFFPDIVGYLPFMFLYEQDNYPGLPGMVYAWADAVVQRDEVLFQALASAASLGGFGGISQGMYNAIACTDGDAEIEARAFKKDLQAHPVLGGAFGNPEFWDRRAALCAELGMNQRPADQYLPVETDLPSLIIEGDMDPITPPPNAKAILPGFANGTYVEFPYAGHGPSRSVECAGDMLNKFYDDPTLEPDLSCVEEMEEPQMWAPLYVSRVAPRLLLLLSEDKQKLAIPGGWAGGSILISLIAFLVLTFAPPIRWMDGRRGVRAGGARVIAWLAATASVAAVGIMGTAVAITAETSEMMPLFGFVPWARYGAWCGLAAGALGLLTLLATYRARREQGLPGSRFVGFTLTGIAALSLSIFMLVWDLGPF